MSDLTFLELQVANRDRNKHWDPEKKLDLLFFSNELGGEVGEVSDAGLKLLELMTRLSRAAGQAQNICKKVRRSSLGLPGSQASVADLMKELADTCIVAALIANVVEEDLGEAVVGKFNATSDKLNLPVRL
jgi:NTP pyrophosphatase (non-canonical NTP hydrolase)